MVEPLQSAYRSQHSTETALLKVKADILHAMDNQKVTCLIMLDLSVAFDTVLHSPLLYRLKFRFGLGDTIIEWLQSLSSWLYTVSSSTQHSVRSSSVKTGSPTRICVGSTPIWSLNSPLGDICKRHNVEFHLYTGNQKKNILALNPDQPQNQVLKIYTYVFQDVHQLTGAQ